MTDINFHKVVQFFLNINLKIEDRIYKTPKFFDTELEDQYRQEALKHFKKNKPKTDAFFVFCYLAMILYMYLHGYGTMFIYLAIACLGLSVTLISISYYKKSSSFNLAINYAMITLFSVFLNFKIIYIACYLNTKENDNDAEIIRTIIYDFVSKNILCLALDTRISFTVGLFLINLVATIIAQIKSNSNHFYYMDSLTAVVVTLCFQSVKTSWEVQDRTIFAGKYQFEKYYNYSSDFIKGLNGCYINITNDNSIYCDSKIKTLMNEKSLGKVISSTNNLEKHDEINDNSISIKVNEINSLMPINFSELEENLSLFSAYVLNHFKLFQEGANQSTNDKEEKLGENLKVIMRESSTANFNTIGIYKVETSLGIKYFDVHFRKFSLNNKTSIHDIMLYEITELIISRQKIVEENIIKHKILAKIVHEFKTPVNSIIGVIASIEESINKSEKESNKATIMHLNTARNLSNYVIFLISDIIHFTNVKSMEGINMNFQFINLRETVNFGFDILNSLLRCNKSKCDAIQTALDFDSSIDGLKIKADDLRLKQIILNFISNAVKFTKAGSIILKCTNIPHKQIVLLSISDTGVGISENEKEKLFNDFKMVKNETINNTMGSGLGLSICKSLSSSMNMEISSSSIYGVGSEFSLAIPVVPASNSNRSIKELENLQSVCLIRSEFNLIKSNLIDHDKYNHTERSISSYVDQANEINIYKIKDAKYVKFGLKSHTSSSKTVRLGNDYIIPRININTLDLNLNAELSGYLRNNTSRVNSHLSNNMSLNFQENLDIRFKKKAKILIVDDNHYVNEANKTIIGKVHKEAGVDMEIVIGTDGLDIIHEVIHDQSKGNEIKCILTDENMEYINGSEAIGMIRNFEKNHKVKFVNIISVTSNEDSEYTRHILNSGAQLVLGKPLSKSVITSAFKSLNII